MDPAQRATEDRLRRAARRQRLRLSKLRRTAANLSGEGVYRLHDAQGKELVGVATLTQVERYLQGCEHRWTNDGNSTQLCTRCGYEGFLWDR